MTSGEQEGLFWVEPTETPEPPPQKTPGEIRRERQDECVRHGTHPLNAALRDYRHRPLPLHTDTERTCGGCRFRRQVHATSRPYPKCLWVNERGHHPHYTNGPGTDVLARWPACVHHEPKEKE